MKKILLVTVFAFFSPLAYACMGSLDINQSFVVEGRAQDVNGNPLYVEHLSRVGGEDGGLLKVDYFDEGGQLIAKKLARFDCNPTSPSFILTDVVTGATEGVRFQGEELISFTDGTSQNIKVPSGPTIVDAGFDHAIRLNWDDLMAGKKMKFEYFFPREGQFIKLRFSKSAPPSEIYSWLDKDAVFFKVGANNLLFRLLSSPIYVGYDKNTKMLKHYIGPSNLPVMKHQKQVIISYDEKEIM